MAALPAINGYEIKSKIADCTIGKLYHATQLSMGREVALKVIDTRLQEANREQILKEAQTLGKVNHPNAVGVYDIGDYRHYTYFAMTFAGNGSLSKKINHNKYLSELTVLSLAEQICNALKEAHAQHITHRCLHPEKILINNDGFYLLAEMGFGKLRRENKIYNYMAPEVVLGRSTSISSDIYSLGAILYHALTGCIPFQGLSDAELKDAIVETYPVPISDIRLKINQEFQNLIVKMMAKQAIDRPKNCDEVLNEIKKIAGRQNFDNGRNRSSQSKSKLMKRTLAQIARDQEQEKPNLFKIIALIFIILTLLIWVYDQIFIG